MVDHGQAMWTNDPKQLAAKLRRAADEMRAEDQNGWPVLCDTVADYLEAAPSPSPAPGVTEEMVEAMAAVLLGRVNAPEQEIYAAARDGLQAALESRP